MKTYKTEIKNKPYLYIWENDRYIVVALDTGKVYETSDHGCTCPSQRMKDKMSEEHGTRRTYCKHCLHIASWVKRAS